MTPDWSTLLLQLVIFLVLAWLLRRFLFAPVKRVIEQRRQEMLSREKPWTPRSRDRQVSKALRAYAKMATSADKGAVRLVD